MIDATACIALRDSVSPELVSKDQAANLETSSDSSSMGNETYAGKLEIKGPVWPYIYELTSFLRARIGNVNNGTSLYWAVLVKGCNFLSLMRIKQLRRRLGSYFERDERSFNRDVMFSQRLHLAIQESIK